MLRTSVAVVMVLAIAACGGSSPAAQPAAAPAAATPAPQASPAAASPAAATSPTPATAEDAYDNAAALASAGQFDQAQTAFNAAARAFPEQKDYDAALADLD